MLKVVVFARLASYFFLLSQEKWLKKKELPPTACSLAAKLDGRQAKTRFAQTVACRQFP
jgi:hypothetical protein